MDRLLPFGPVSVLNFLTLVSFIFLLPFLTVASPISCKKWYLKSQSSVGSVNQKIQTYKQLIGELLQKQPNEVNPGFFETRWSCTSGSCMSLSEQIQTALAGFNRPVERVAIATLYRIRHPGLPNGALHFFAVDRSLPHQEIIIDPTYKQFFNGPIPEADIFVGTRADLEDLFIRYHSRVKMQDGSDPKAYDPKGIAEAYYGYGRGAKTKFGKSSREF